MILRLINSEAEAACPFAATRRQVVADEVGDRYAAGGIMIVGEAPGYYEDLSGRPFYGDSGRALEALLDLAELTRADVYITNVVRCRPPANKTPSRSQVAFHRQFVEEAIAWAQPLVIIAVGASALTWFRESPKLTNCHGKPFRWHGSIVVPVFHPAYAMRNPAIWPLLHADFAALQSLQEPGEQQNYRVATDDEAAAIAESARRVGFDLETTDTKVDGVFYPHLQRILGYSVSAEPGVSVYVPNAPGAAMRRVLEDASIVKVCHNTKFEYQLLHGAGIELRGYEDTKLMAYLLQEHSTHLKDLSYQLLDVKQLHLEDVTHGRPTDELTPEEWLPYAAADADVTLQLANMLLPRLEREGLMHLYRAVELPLVPILAAAERRGVTLDADVLAPLAAEMQGRRADLAVELKAWFGDINIGSVQQVGEVIFGPKHVRVVETAALKTRSHIRYVPAGFGIAVDKKTPTGRAALDKEVFERLASRHPAIRLLAEYHRLGDYLSDFVEKLPKMVLADGAIHTSINQAGGWEDQTQSRESPASGRMSSSNPNLMQIPKRDPEIAKRIRQAFVPRAGYTWVSADMKQQEPRIAAVVSGDVQYRADFNAGIDIYMPVAALLKQAAIHDPTATVTKTERDSLGLEYRDSAKNKILLPVTNGAGAHKIVALLPYLTIAQASGIVTWLHKRYPQLTGYAKRVEQEVLECGYTSTLFGRKRWFPGVWQRQTRAESVRQAVNHPIQGTGADVLKQSLAWLDMQLRGLDAHFLWPIHDSVDYEVRSDQVKDVCEILSQMTSWFREIQLPVEVSTGANWGELKETIA